MFRGGRQGQGSRIGHHAANDECRQVTGNGVDNGRAAHDMTRSLLPQNSPSLRTGTRIVTSDE